MKQKQSWFQLYPESNRASNLSIAGGAVRLLSLLLLLSMLLSRQWFYPYPAYDMGSEYGAAYTETA